MTQYTKITAETKHSIWFAVRRKKYLVINTNFNPIIAIDFVEEFLCKMPFVARSLKLNVYDDGTGYIILLIEKNIHPDIVDLFVKQQFNDYFFNHKFNNDH